MARLEDLTRGASVRGVLPAETVAVVDVRWHGSAAIELTYKDAQGKPGNRLVFRGDDEASIEVLSSSPQWNFDADPTLFRLVAEAHRIRLAYLFDPLLAVHTSLVEPLPHQILAVYGEMLSRQPLRFLLADDPGAGKTIMAGLFIKELIARGDLRRCLVICPGALAEQWQDELQGKFQIGFEILTSDKVESARTGNWLAENDLVIARLDKLSRDEDLRAKLEMTDWDLVIVDEAHKMSASFFGGEVKETLRYKLGRLVGRLTRHLLLMTATPHNGKEEDFQLFLALLDGDRFEGKFRDGVHVVDPSDLMRRLVKEQILKFDGTPLFPERRAYSPTYKLSNAEAHLYAEVTNYVRDEFNRADHLDDKRKGTVGFALTVLQRRLASSPEAIFQSLRRRRERMEARLAEEDLLRRGIAASPGRPAELLQRTESVVSVEDVEDLDDAPDSEVEDVEEKVVDQATAARTIAELRAEIGTLKRLEALADAVRKSGTDKKWEELSNILQNEKEMFDAVGHRRKLIIFTEHRDTLTYLSTRITRLLGRPEALVAIHGGVGRDDRRKIEALFTQDKTVEVLVATDAAGEGINLQRSHLMVNYDLPWNPNRLEQRFGRIHRIGQTEVCHLWNLVADETREGEVFKRLFEKLEEERKALGGGVFDILGKLFRDRPLRDLLVEAIRYGDQPERRAELQRAVDNLSDRNRCRELLEERALARDTMDARRVSQIREEMERADARRLQPHFIAAFFMEAFSRLGGTMRQREPKRWEVSHVPAIIRARDRQIGRAAPVLDHYERISFEKRLIAVPGQPLAAFVCPGHPLLDSVLDLILEQFRGLLRQGAILIDPADDGETPRALFFLEHSITDARTDSTGNRRVVSRDVRFVEVGPEGAPSQGGPAPHLDYRPATEEERKVLAPALTETWLRGDLEARVLSWAISDVVPRHLSEAKKHREGLVDKTRDAVRERLLKEINYWDHRSEELKAQEQAGKNPRLNSGLARKRADDLQARLTKRLAELEQERSISALPPVVVGGALVIPAGLLAKLNGKPMPTLFAKETARVEALAMAAVMAAERQLGFEPRDVSKDRCGYDIESRIPGQGRLRFIEVKGRVAGATTVTVTKNEILTALNKPEDFILALVEVDGEAVSTRYVRTPFQKEPDFTVTSINYDLPALLAHAEDPR